MMFTGNLRADYALDRYREALREAERRRLWTGEGLRAAQAREAVRQAFERIGRWCARQGELCLNLEPACEMPNALRVHFLRKISPFSFLG